MLSKLFHKEYPEFWKKYSESFKNQATKYVVISMETSGLDTEKDVIMSVAATSIVENRILLKDSFEIYIKHAIPKDVSFENDFIAVNKVEKIAENSAIETLISYLGNSILIGHRIDFDIEMLNQSLSRLKLGKLKNEAYDIEAMFNKIAETNEKKYALEDMSKSLNIAISNRNSVADDAYSIAILFLKLKSKLGIK